MDGEAHLHLETQVTFERAAEDKGIEYEAIYGQKKKIPAPSSSGRSF